MALLKYAQKALKEKLQVLEETAAMEAALLEAGEELVKQISDILPSDTFTYADGTSVEFGFIDDGYVAVQLPQSPEEVPTQLISVKAVWARAPRGIAYAFRSDEKGEKESVHLELSVMRFVEALIDAAAPVWIEAFIEKHAGKEPE